MINAIQSLFRRKQTHPGLKMKFQVLAADYGIGKVMATCNTKDDAISTIQQLASSRQSYAIREVLLSAE
jgi:hypothetical protein